MKVSLTYNLVAAGSETQLNLQHDTYGCTVVRPSLRLKHVEIMKSSCISLNRPAKGSGKL